MTTKDQDAKHYEGLAARVRGDIAGIRDMTALAEFVGGDIGNLKDLFRRHAHSTPAEFLPEEIAV
jgi:hypothetical protein